jgi:pyruvate dehydrogenase E2 component (dihydrolipoamide acetyltransferase)
MIEVALPSLGADMDEGTLLEWHVRPGDAVKRGQVVAVVDTTKAAIDVECWDDGTVDELIVEPGTRIPVNTVLALLRAPGETDEAAAQWKAAHAAARPAAPAVAPGAAPTPAPLAAAPAGAAGAGAARRRVSPAARVHAEELGVALDAVVGTGPDGAIRLEDVERAARAGVPAARPPGAAATPPAASAAAGRAAEMRRTIAAAMARSKREIPHYYLATEVPLAAASRWLAEQNAARPVTERLLMAVLFLKAVARALVEYPELNGFVRGEVFQPSPAVHVGVAVSLRQGGLVAPAILDADRKDLGTLMRELGDLVRRARVFSLRSSELSLPTVTVTNLGDQGVDSVFGVIYPPQVALVGFGSVRERAWVDDGGLKLIPVVSATLAADHRASDGHRGALFLGRVRALLQQPETL